MSKRTLGGKIELTGEKKYRESIKKIVTDLTVLKSEMDVVGSSFEKNDRSVENLTKQNEVLEKQISKTKEKIEQLRLAHENSAKQIGEEDKITKNWAIELNRAQSSLLNLERNLKNNNIAIENSKKGIDEEKNSLKKLSNEFLNCAKNSIKFGDILRANLTSDAIKSSIKSIFNGVKNIGKAFISATYNAGEYADKFLKLSNKTGISTDTLQNFNAVSKRTGIDLEIFTKAIAKNTKAMSSAIDNNKNSKIISNFQTAAPRRQASSVDTKSIQKAKESNKKSILEINKQKQEIIKKSEEIQKKSDEKLIKSNEKLNKTILDINKKTEEEIDKLRQNSGILIVSEMIKKSKSMDNYLDIKARNDARRQALGEAIERVKQRAIDDEIRAREKNQRSLLKINSQKEYWSKKISDIEIESTEKIKNANEKLNEIIKNSNENMTNSMIQASNSFKNFNNNFDNFTQNTEKANSAYRQLGISILDANGQMRDSQTVFWEIINALREIENPTQRDAIAMQIFGKNAQELNPIIKMSAKEFNDITKNAQDLGQVLDNDTLISLQNIKRSMDSWKSTMEKIKFTIIAALAPAITKLTGQLSNTSNAFAKLVSAIVNKKDIEKARQEFKKELENLIEEIENFLPDFFDAGKDIVGELVKGLSKAVSQSKNEILAIGTIFTGFVAGWSALITVAIAAWPVAIGAALTAALYLISPDFKKFVDSIGSIISKGFEVITHGIADFLLWIDKKITENNKKNEKNREDIERKNKETDQAISNFFTSSWSKLTEFFTNSKNKLVEIAENVKDFVVDKFKNFKDNFIKIGEDLIHGIWDGISNMWTWLKEKMIEFGKNLIGLNNKNFQIKSPSKVFAKIGKNLALGLGLGFTDEMKNISNQITNSVPTDFNNLKISQSQMKSGFNSNYDSIYNQNLSTNKTLDFLIYSFQNSLKGMAFKVDDEKIGELIINKVENIIYN